MAEKIMLLNAGVGGVDDISDIVLELAERVEAIREYVGEGSVEALKGLKALYDLARKGAGPFQELLTANPLDPSPDQQAEIAAAIAAWKLRGVQVSEWGTIVVISRTMHLDP